MLQELICSIVKERSFIKQEDLFVLLANSAEGQREMMNTLFDSTIANMLLCGTIGSFTLDAGSGRVRLLTVADSEFFTKNLKAGA